MSSRPVFCTETNSGDVIVGVEVSGLNPVHVMVHVPPVALVQVSKQSTSSGGVPADPK